MKLPAIPKLTWKREYWERVMVGGAAALVLFLAARGTSTPMVEVPYNQVPQEVASLPLLTVPMQETTLYYRDGTGFLVPVTLQVPQQAGIAKATLSLLTHSPLNDLEAAAYGLYTIAPAGTTYELDIAAGHARVDVSAEVLSLATAEEEQQFVSACVETLTTFDTVDTVDFLVGGQKRSKLTNGTDISGIFAGGDVNLESVSAGIDKTGAATVSLYFPSESGRVLVPVTRVVFSEPDLTTALLELLKGPKNDSGLERALPKDCALLDVKVVNGTAIINLTKEFEAVLSDRDMSRHALRAMLLTCAKFPGVTRVEIQVDGKPLVLEEEPTKTTLAVNSAEELAVWFPGVMEVE